MGGFHGGHSGGGGGHHSGGHHGGGYHGGHHSYGGGHYGGPVHTHRVVDGRHYIDGKRYYGPYYGTANGKPMTFFTSMLVGAVITIIGIILFFVLFVGKTVATITKVGTGHDYTGTYCVYDFEYEYRGKKYLGYGDDDDFTIQVDDQYQLYVNVVDPSKYKFENTNTLAFVLGGIVTILGLAAMASTVNTRRKHMKLLEEVGDANGDGVINDADLEYAEMKSHGEAKGVYEGMKDATYEKVRYEERKDIKCPYCDSLLDINDKFCQNCGAALGKK